MPLTEGEFLLMPSEFGADVGVKVLTIVPDNTARNIPVIQGLYILFDAQTGTPTALLDGIEMTGLRTAAASLAAVRDRVLAGEHPLRVVVFGAGIQACSHLRTLFAVVDGKRAVGDVVVAVRRPHDVKVRDIVESADVPAAVVGSGPPSRPGGGRSRSGDVHHAVSRASFRRHPGPRRRDGHLRGRARTACARSRRRIDPRSLVMVEDPATALRDVGAVISALAAGRFDRERLIPLTACADLDVGGSTSPLVFISVGMSWEDLVIASAVAAAIA